MNLSADDRPRSFIHLSAGPSFVGLLSTGQYVQAVADANATATFGKRYVFASLHQTTLSFDTRAEWTLAPAVSLQFYMQPFISAGRYVQFKEFLAPRTYRFAVYGVDRGMITRSGSVTTIDPDA